jgi:predicted DCC family thiol-disulfide oxidoreductase YuxK
VASSEVDLDALGLSQEDVSRYVWLITDDEHLAGAAAIAAICRHQPQWRWRFIGHLMDTWPVSVLAELSYRVISASRMFLPHPKCHCELPGVTQS